jgi:DNA-binding NarL/FixJ family response regulator
MPHRIFIVEDHPAMLSTYQLLIERTPDLVMAGAVRTGEEALVQIPLQHPDLVLVDMALPRMHGLDLIHHLQALQPHLPILIVSGHEREAYLKPQAPPLSPMVKGYIMKDQGIWALLTAIRQVFAAGQE